THHFLCTALSPAFHSAFSAPVVFFLAAAFLLGGCFFTGVVGEPNMPSFVCSQPTSNSSAISDRMRLTSVSVLFYYHTVAQHGNMNTFCISRIVVNQLIMVLFF